MINNTIGALLYFLGILAVTDPLAAQETAGRYATREAISYYDSSGGGLYRQERCRLDLYYPLDVKGFATVVWFHGGGLTEGEKYIPEQLKGEGIAIAAVNYRLSPGVSAVAALEDAAAAVAWVFRHIAGYGGSPAKVVVSGHSAGGYLALMTGLDKQRLASHGIDADSIACLAPFSGHAITHMQVRKEMGIPDTRPLIDTLAPLWHVRANAPPLHLITGDRELEILGRYEENAYLWRMMKVAGHSRTFLYELDGFDHGNMTVPGYSLLLQIMRQQGL